MAMIKKTAPGSAEAMKAVKNGKNASKTPKGGTQRTSFTGSSDSRSGAGAASGKQYLKNAPGLIDDGPVMMETQNGKQPNNTVSGGPNAGVNKKYSASNENVNSGMGGKVYTPMKPFGASGSQAPFSNNVKK